MLHTEVIECLRPLDDETLASIMRMIFDWNDGLEVKPTTQVEKFAWALVLPKLEKNKITYEAKIKQTTEAANKRWNKQKDTNECERMREDTNYNYNYNNSSKEELCIDDKQPSSNDEVVSKGLETLENAFPERKRDIGITEINLWNGLTQPQKANLIKKAVLYVRGEMKNENGKFIKKMSKWLSEEISKGVKEELIPNKKATTKQTFKMIDGTIYAILQSKLDSTRDADLVWHTLNVYGLTKEEFYDVVRTETKENLLEIIKN